MALKFFKHNERDAIFWANGDHYGQFYFSFDKKKIYNLFEDYPWKLSREEKGIFDRENPFWADYFRGRNYEQDRDNRQQRKSS